jgi:23S rRNA pseudouridine955/2504/2580 synthase
LTEDSYTKVSIEEIGTNSSNQRVDNFLLGKFKDLPKSKIYSIIRKGEVRINGSRVKPHFKLSLGDKIRIPPLFLTKKSTLSSPEKGLIEEIKGQVIYEDGEILVINKKHNLAVHGGSRVSIGLIEIVRNFGKDYRDAQLVHRLDKATSGCIIVAKNKQSTRLYNSLIRSNQIIKKYHCLIHGSWPKKLNNIRLPLKVNKNENLKKTIVSDDGKYSSTNFKLIKFNENFSLLECSLETGRTHQIRVHTSASGFPIAGDFKYSSMTLNSDMEKRMYLHCSSLEILEKDLKITSKVPNSFFHPFEV